MRCEPIQFTKCNLLLPAFLGICMAIAGCTTVPGPEGGEGRETHVSVSSRRRDNDFFCDRRFVQLLEPLARIRQAVDTNALISFMKERASKIKSNAQSVPREEESLQLRYDSFVDELLIYGPSDASPSGLWQAASCVADGARLTYSEPLVAKKCVLTIAFAKQDSKVNHFPVFVLAQLCSSKAAATALLQIALYASDENLALLAMRQVCGEGDALTPVHAARGSLAEFRSKASKKAESPLALGVIAKEANLQRINSEQLPRLIANVYQLRVAERERLRDEQWRKYEAEYQQAVARFIQRVEPAAKDQHSVATDYTSLWGIKKGKREIDQIPVGARVSGIEVTRGGGVVYGIHFLYELNGKPGATPWRGGRSTPPTDSVNFEKNEYINSFTVEGAGDIIMRIKIVTNLRTLKFYSGGVVVNNWKMPCEPGRSLSGEVELDVMGLPVAIGLVTYVDDRLRAFGLVRQFAIGGGIPPRHSKERVTERIGNFYIPK